MKLEQVNIRDPFILPYSGIYYLYGTRSATCWGLADGFDCYTSPDLENWEGPFEIFHRPRNFPMDRNYWAPECYERDGKFYLLTTLGAEHTKKGAYLLAADSPKGPFLPYSGILTPADWTCIDGTLYRAGSRTYLIFSHSFEDGVYDGDMCYVELSADWKTAVTRPKRMFSAKQAGWPKPIPFARQEFGIDSDCYFTDGPFALADARGALHIYWSSWCTRGYAVGEAISESGSMDGPWTHSDRLIFPENGGHGMAFRRFDGELIYTLHYPNDSLKEHPIFIDLKQE